MSETQPLHPSQGLRVDPRSVELASGEAWMAFPEGGSRGGGAGSWIRRSRLQPTGYSILLLAGLGDSFSLSSAASPTPFNISGGGGASLQCKWHPLNMMLLP